MIRNFAENIDEDYEWLDVLDPKPGEMAEMARSHGLHEESVNDCLQPGHLPKYERFKGYTFIIVRVYYPQKGHEEEADTVQELTNKVAIFISDKFIITIHRNEWAPLKTISSEYVTSGECKHPAHVLTEIVKAAMQSYAEPGDKITRHIEYYEEQVFLKDRNVSFLKRLYFLKRKIDVIRRLLLLSHDIVDKIDSKENGNAYTRECRDVYVRQQSLYDSLLDQATHLMNVYFNISAQRTNEIMRVLTIFSVFFMPLTFIVGVYGMNFKYMPELEQHWGYPGVMGLMAVVIVVVYVWFKRKHWL